jgi:hypothetical protein
VIENGFAGFQNQYRRLISFNANGNECKYVAKNTNSSLVSGRELDGRPVGYWKLVKDTLYINWDGYYIGLNKDENNNEKKLNRSIIGKYRIEIIDNTIQLKFISENILSAEIDSDDPDIAYHLYYNDGIDGLYYKPVDCTNAEAKYMASDFTPSKKKDTYTEDYNKSHSCNDQRSFDAGYDLARDQIGKGLMADCDYLYKIALSVNSNLNHYCFCKGVNQYINDKKTY